VAAFGAIKAASLATEPSYPPNLLIHLQTIKSVVHVHDMAEGSKLCCAQQKNASNAVDILFNCM
jgi:hypothetical protein